MGQRENLWGRNRPPTGMTLTYEPDTDGQWLGGTATLWIHFHRPEPAIVEVATLNEWAAAYLSTLYVHVWDAMKYGSAAQAAMAFQIQARRLNEEWHGE